MKTTKVKKEVKENKRGCQYSIVFDTEEQREKFKAISPAFIRWILLEENEKNILLPLLSKFTLAKMQGKVK